MIRNYHLFNSYKEYYYSKRKYSYKNGWRIYDSLYRQARSLGIIPTDIAFKESAAVTIARMLKAARK